MKALKPIAAILGLTIVLMIVGMRACEPYAAAIRRERTEEALLAVAASTNLDESTRSAIAAARRRNEEAGFADRVHRTLDRRCAAILADGAVTLEEGRWLAEILEDAVALETVAFILKHPGGR